MDKSIELIITAAKNSGIWMSLDLSTEQRRHMCEYFASEIRKPLESSLSIAENERDEAKDAMVNALHSLNIAQAKLEALSKQEPIYQMGHTIYGHPYWSDISEKFADGLKDEYKRIVYLHPSPANSDISRLVEMLKESVSLARIKYGNLDKQVDAALSKHEALIAEFEGK